MGTPRSSVEVLLEVCVHHEQRTALVHGDRRLSYADLRTDILRMAQALVHCGLGSGDNVTLLGANAPEMVIAKNAANLIGCSVSQLYNGISVESKAAIVTDVEAKALLVDPHFADDAREILERCAPDLVCAFGPGPGTDLLALAATQPAEVPSTRARAGDVQQIRHTGGTTGHPKGICYTFDTTLQAVQHLRQDEFVTPDARQLVCTTIAHAAGGIADFVLLDGGVVVLHDEFEPGAVLETIERERITDMWLLPPLLYQLLDHPHSVQADLSSLQRVFYGGCAASPTRLEQAVRRFGPVLTQVYGQTEAGMIAVLPPEEHDTQRPELLRTVGHPAPNVTLKVCDEHGNELPQGSRGELWVSGPLRMDGYWKQPELTARTIQDGWVHTGDVGYLDDEGFVHLVDRVKDMIVVVGGHVYTSEVEDVLMQHPAVRHAAVFGVADPDGAESVHVAVVNDLDHDVSADDLRQLVRRRKGAMYVPAEVRFVDRIPLTDAGKPDKKTLRARLMAEAGVR